MRYKMHCLLGAVIFSMTSLLVTSSSILPSITATIHIPENAQKNYIVANTNDFLAKPVRNSKYQLFNQKLLSPNSNLPDTSFKEWMNLNDETGLVTLRHQVDREVLCGESSSCIIQLRIYVKKIKQLVVLDVVIDDVNDNPPQFPTQSISVNVSESVRVGDQISLNQFTATDPDTGTNSFVTYSINQNPYFKLQQFKDAADTVHLLLEVTKPLDYEKSSEQHLVLIAQDGGTPPLESRVNILVKISDVNDNEPMFDRTEYRVELSENLHPGYRIIKVHAQDKDSGKSGAIQYSVSRQNKGYALHLVAVNPITGEVTLQQKLDRERHDKARILLEAHDLNLANQKIGRSWLQINITDVNDNCPVIHINYILTSYQNTVYLPENVHTGESFAYVEAKDEDLASNGEVSISIQSVISEDASVGRKDRSSDNIFELEPNGFLSVKKSLDREKEGRYKLTLKACDHAKPPKCTEKIFIVVLLDVNDHPPRFEKPALDFILPENTSVGTVITKMQATDGDATNYPALYENKADKTIINSPYGDVTYRIVNGDGTFSINPLSGEITLTRPLDHEEVKRYQLIVRAKDGDRQKSLESDCQVTIKISDVNDNKPHFVYPAFDNATFYATIVRHDVIMSVRAEDYDEGAKGQIRYRILTQDGSSLTRNRKSSLFIINSINGDIKLNFGNRKLNESLGTHRLVVEARDLGKDALTSNRIIDVIVTDLTTLPKNNMNDLVVKSSSPSPLVIVLVLLVVVSILLILVIFGIAKCRSARKKTRTYKCRHDSSDMSEWGQSSMVNWRKSPVLKRALSRETSIASGKSVSNQIKNRSDIFLEKSPGDLDSSTHTLVKYSSRSSVRESCYYPMEGASYSSQNQQNCYSVPRLTVSSHDGDSGRGDSDPDVALSDVTYDRGTHVKDALKLQSSFSSKSKSSFHSPSNSKCTSQCLLYGHSDSCWMPNLAQEQHPHLPFVRDDVSLTSPLYVELSPPNQSPLYSEFHDHQNLEPIPETKTLRHFWPYPANDLRSIYADVIVNSQRQEFYQTRHHNHRESLRHRDGMSLHHRPNRLNPASSILAADLKSYSLEKQTSQKLNIEQNQENVSKRSNVSLHLPSSPKKESLSRCASADELDSEVSTSVTSSLISESRFKEETQPTSNKQSGSEVSMRETEEIVENIEKLLNS